MRILSFQLGQIQFTFLGAQVRYRFISTVKTKTHEDQINLLQGIQAGSYIKRMIYISTITLTITETELKVFGRIANIFTPKGNTNLKDAKNMPLIFQSRCK